MRILIKGAWPSLSVWAVKILYLTPVNRRQLGRKSVCFPLSVTSHSWLTKNKVDQCVWAEVTAGLPIRKDGHSEQRICMLTERTKQWLYFIKSGCLTYTSCFVFFPPVGSDCLRRERRVFFNTRKGYFHIFITSSLYSCLSSVSCRMSCLLTASADQTFYMFAQ